MTAFYVMRIRAGKMSLEEVHARWRSQVAAMLEENQSVKPVSV